MPSTRRARPQATEFPPAARQPTHKLARGECISNSLDMAMLLPGLRYAEGVAKGALGFWYAHAWNVNAAGEAVDFTWRETGARYLGRVIGTDVKVAAAVRAERYMFDRPLPYIPDGELGLDCFSRSQEEAFAILGAHAGHQAPEKGCPLCGAEEEARRA
jgi:hypothetical protein